MMDQYSAGKPACPSFSGNDAAEFARIFNTYYPRLCHFSFQLTRDRSLAEDICQDAFIRFWDHREYISPMENAVKSYLYTTVRNASISSLRHHAVVRQYRDRYPRIENDDITVIHAIIRSEITAEIYQALETLPQGCREVVSMAYLQGMKNKEIASELGVSVNTVKTQRQRALHLLRSRVHPEVFLILIYYLV